MTMGMTDPKTSKSDDGKGVPPGGESKTAEARPADSRLFPGGSPAAARTPIGVNAVDKDAMWIDEAVVGGTKSTS
jgi:hypothetical protein